MARAINRLKACLLYFGIDYSSNFEGYISARVITWLRKLHMTNEAGVFTLKKYIDELVYQRNELGKITKALRSQTKNSRHAIIKVARKLALIAKGVVQKLQMYNAAYSSSPDRGLVAQ